jgi:hypothetical protein
MRSLSRQTLLTGMLAVVLASAFATPASATLVYTTTSNSIPFATPIGSTAPAQSSNWTLYLGGFLFYMTCNYAEYSDFIGVTNTQRRMVSYVVGNGSGRSCRGSLGSFTATVDGDRFNCGASASNPWLVHLRSTTASRRNPPMGRSAAGTVYMASHCSFNVTLVGRYQCSIVIYGGTSVGYSETTENTDSIISTASGYRPFAEARGRTCLFPGQTQADLDALYTYVANPEHVIV